MTRYRRGNRITSGRRGGRTTRDRYGIEHYREIGRKGGLRKKGEKAAEELRRQQQEGTEA